jgi:plastocyanin
VRRSIVLAVVTLTCVGLAAPPAQAAVQVSVAEFAFSPATIIVPQGEDVAWHDGGTRQHTSTGDGPLSLWDTGRISPGATSSSVDFSAAGTYPYHCSVHPFMHGTVRVPIVVSPRSGTKRTTFTVHLAAGGQTGFTYDVQKRRGSGAWITWRIGVTATSVRFHGGNGTFSFRSRLHRRASAATSGWSPATKIRVR